MHFAPIPPPPSPDDKHGESKDDRDQCRKGDFHANVEVAVGIPIRKERKKNNFQENPASQPAVAVNPCERGDQRLDNDQDGAVAWIVPLVCATAQSRNDGPNPDEGDQLIPQPSRLS